MAPAAAGDDVALVGAVGAPSVPLVDVRIDRVLNGVTSMVSTLADAVKSIGDQVNTQGRAMESLGVIIGKMNQPVASPQPEKRRALVGFVDTDEEYSEYEELKAARGKGEISKLQRGTLQMLQIRRSVKSRYFGHLGGATITNEVLPDGDADWEMLLEETMEELELDAPDAYDFLISDISPPVKRRNPSRKKGKGKGAGKGKKRAASRDTVSGTDSSSCSDDGSDTDGAVGEAKRTGRDKKSVGAKKAKNGDDTVRAYQPMAQSISHVLEAVKRRVVPTWFEKVNSSRKTMGRTTAANWLENMNQLPDDEDEITQEQRDAPVRPRFICSDDGHDAVLAAVKEMFTHLGVADRIRVPEGLGNKENVHTTTGHIALVAMFVRAELDQIAAGVRRKRRGKDNGWYDRWRWEILTVHPLMPTTTAPWRGYVVNDVNSPTRCDFEHPPVPINSIRTRTVRARPVRGDAAAPPPAAEGSTSAGSRSGATGAADGHASTGSAAQAAGVTEAGEAGGVTTGGAADRA